MLKKFEEIIRGRTYKYRYVGGKSRGYYINVYEGDKNRILPPQFLGAPLCKSRNHVRRKEFQDFVDRISMSNQGKKRG